MTQCAICFQKLHLDARRIYRIRVDPKDYYGIEPEYTSNLSVWCYKHPVIELPCFSKETLEKMREIKASGEKSHLIKWKDDNDDYVKVTEEDD